MAQKIRKINFRSVKWRVAGNKEVQGGGEDEQCQVANFRNLRIFAGCENFHNLRNPQAQFAPPKLNTCNKTK